MNDIDAAFLSIRMNIRGQLIFLAQASYFELRVLDGLSPLITGINSKSINTILLSLDAQTKTKSQNKQSYAQAQVSMVQHHLGRCAGAERVLHRRADVRRGVDDADAGVFERPHLLGR